METGNLDAGHVLLSPSTICYGPGAVRRTGAVLKDGGAGRVLIVTDGGVRRAGIVDRVTSVLDRDGIAWDVFDRVQPEPVLENVREGLDRFASGDFDALLAVGGGSSIDCAKAISIARANGTDLASFKGVERVPKVGPPVYAVPTTAGTGSEVTRVLVITDTGRSEKMMIASRHAVCRGAIVDPELTVGLPRAITAATGVDAFAHALEAYVSLKAQPLTDVWALSAARRIGRNLRRAYSAGHDLAARSEVMLGATEAGLAFSNASVALIHGMARPMGAFFHLPHGVCIALLMPLVTRHSWMASIERYAAITEAIGARLPGEPDESAAARLADLLQGLVDDVGIRPLREQLGPDVERWASVIETMAEQAIESGSPANHPLPVDEGAIGRLYMELLG